MNYISNVKVQLVKESRSFYDDAFANNPDNVAKISRKYLNGADREYCIVLMLNSKSKVICIETISVGSMNASIVHPREVFKGAILANATGIIFCHNHPSGNIYPSIEDLDITKKLIAAGKILGINLIDSLVIDTESENFYSMRQRNAVEF